MQTGQRPLTADIIALVYLVSASVALATRWEVGPEYQMAVQSNLLLALVVWCSWVYRHRFRAVGFLRMFYPLPLIGLAFVQVGLFARVIFEAGFTFDPLVAQWDAMVFSINPHMWYHRAVPGRLAAELMHFLYVQYFPLLFGSFLFVIAKRRHDYPRFAFVFLASFLSFVLVFIAFPATGPLDYREGLFSDAVVFSNLVDYLFSFGIPDPGGAFPSSHVGQSVVVLLLLLPLSRPVTALIVFVIIGIGVSMAYISVHYQIDAVVGVPAGIALYVLWNAVYLRWLANREQRA